MGLPGFVGSGFGSQQAGLSFFLEPVALPLDIQGRRVMQQTVKDRGGQYLVVEDLAPVHETLIRSQEENVPYAER